MTADFRSRGNGVRRRHALVLPMLVYGLASFVHFLHNAVYLDAYPNMPPWLTPVGVMASWLVVAATGAAGYWLSRREPTALGLALVAVYAGLGCAGLDHYAIAPVAAHSWAMSATILAEVAAAAWLLALTAWHGWSLLSQRGRGTLA